MERTHTPLLRVKTPKNVRKRLRSVSPKRRKINEEYSRLREAFLKAHPWCQFSLLELVNTSGYSLPELEIWAQQRVLNGIPTSDEIHHKKGRGKYLLDTSTWMAVSNAAHRWIHEHPKESYEKGYMLPRNK